MTEPHRWAGKELFKALFLLPASRFGYDSPVGGDREARRDRRSGLVLIGLLSSRLFLGVADTFGSASLEFRDRVTNRSTPTYSFPSMSLGLESPSSAPGPAAGLHALSRRFNTKNHF